MAKDNSSKPSVTAGIKFRIALQVAATVVLVAAVVVMVNYLAGRYFLRWNTSTQTRAELSSRTLALVRSLTNHVNVTLFYDRDDELYSTVSALLREYQLNNPKISVRTVDYMRSPAEAQKVKADYGLPASLLPGYEKNWVIFDCEGRVKIFPGKALATEKIQETPSTNGLAFERKRINFNGEVMFTSVLMAITNPKPLKAYFVQGHGEPSPADDKELTGFGQFTIALQQNYIQVAMLSLAGTNPVPEDCNLLIIAGPTEAIPTNELDKVSQYLTEGGRLFALFNFYTSERPTGLEKILAGWGVNVGRYIIEDKRHTAGGQDVLVGTFNKHPVVNSLMGSESALQLVLPRTISAIDPNIQIADAPKVTELAFSGPQSVELNNPSPTPHSFPLMAAVEKGAVKDVVTGRGTTRILVVGDSFFLGNQVIKSALNRDFVGYAADWLLGRGNLLQGLGPRPVTEYRVLMTQSQMKTVQWVLLGVVPGAILLFGGLVWLRRRK